MAKNWAIAIGINNYDHLQPLRYAKRDAELMRDFFLNQAGFDRVFFFTDDSPDVEGKSTKPSRSNLRKVLREVFANPFMADGDNFWFFFSGHGMRYQERDYLMPMDGDPKDVPETAIPTTYITERLRRCGADNVVMVLDACRNEGQKSGVGIGAATEAEARQTGVISLFSCSPEQYSYEIEAMQQGAFTAALLEGLGIRGRCATVERLNQYLKSRVPEMVYQHLKHAKQVPYAVAEPMERTHLILMPNHANLADIAQLKVDAARAERRQQWDIAKRLWIRVLAAASGQDTDAVEAIEHLAVMRAMGQISPQAATPALAIPPFATPQPTPVPAKLAESVTLPPAALTPAPAPQPAPQPPTFSFTTVRVNDSGDIVERIEKTAPYYTQAVGDGVSFDLVKIPGGSFMMGSPEGEGLDRERPQHRVTVPSFYMGKSVVTQAVYEAVMGHNPSRFKGENRPVEQVSWDDAIAFCQTLAQLTDKPYRLPSEAEWEYACRAGTTTPYSFGTAIAPPLANYDGNIGQTSDVGGYPPNGFGLLDMHGNVWEWCADYGHDNYQDAPNDGSAWTKGGNGDRRIRRGGSWGSNSDLCRSAYRYYNHRGSRGDDIGFRVVVSAPGP